MDWRTAKSHTVVTYGLLICMDISEFVTTSQINTPLQLETKMRPILLAIYAIRVVEVAKLHDFSASEVTTLRRYTNLFIIIIIITLSAVA